MAATLDRDRLVGLVEPHWKRVYNFIFRLTLDRDRAERYLADVFALAVQKLGKKGIAKRIYLGTREADAGIDYLAAFIALAKKADWAKARVSR